VIVRRYLRLLALQARASFAVAAQYRVDFFVDGAIEILWTATSLAPLVVLRGMGRAVAGWSFGEALVVIAFFTLLQAVLEGALNPSFVLAVEQARRGTLDHVLMKPADAQFLLSTGRMLPWRAVNVVTALVMGLVAFASLDRAPAPRDVAVALVVFGAALATLYALFTLALASALVWVRTEGVTDLLSGLVDASRWPASVFRGSLRLLLTFVVPLGLLTTFPARALLGTLGAPLAATAVIEAAILLAITRAVWRRALASYRSAS
jgi:ABC-2 type transport system permease protein